MREEEEKKRIERGERREKREERREKKKGKRKNECRHFILSGLLFILMFVGPWARLCLGSSLGLEPITLCGLFILSSL